MINYFLLLELGITILIKFKVINVFIISTFSELFSLNLRYILGLKIEIIGC